MSHRKQFKHDPKILLDDSLIGLAYLNSNLELDLPNKIISLKQLNTNQVHLLCGGGSGHEPSHTSFVQTGMLSAAVCGPVFASPNSQQITKALEKLNNEKGILIIVKNYTGDVLNFGIAKERWIAHHNEDRIRMVIVGDDVSVGKKQGMMTGRRGLAGTVLVYKIAGALAAQGASLDEVHAMAQFIADRCGTIGVGLDHCRIPGSEINLEDKLGSDEIEIGMGIHNETGFKTRPLSDLKTIISELMNILIDTKDPDRSFLPFETESTNCNDVILMINNLGSISELEMNSIVKIVGCWLLDKGINVKRAICGKFMTSLDMNGFSITLILLPKKNQQINISLKPNEEEEAYMINSDIILDLFDFDVGFNSNWKKMNQDLPDLNVLSKDHYKDEHLIVDDHDKKNEVDRSFDRLDRDQTNIIKVKDVEMFIRAIKSGCNSIIESEEEITKYDIILGDGDCGLTLKNGAQNILKGIEDQRINGLNLIFDLLEISDIVQSQMAGTSGALYSIFFNALAVGVSKFKSDEFINAEIWAKALDYALNNLYKYTWARPPSRTMIDPLSTMILRLSLTPNEFKRSVEDAKESAESTIYLESKIGRSAYLDQSKLKNVPDPGAWGVYKLLDGICKAIYQ